MRQLAGYVLGDLAADACIENGRAKVNILVCDAHCDVLDYKGGCVVGIYDKA